MYVSRIEARDFRNFEDMRCELEPGITVLHGSNGQGKTNFLEAILYCATLSSHRATSDAVLVRRGTDEAIIRSTFRSGARRSDVDIRLASSGANTILLAGRQVRRAEIDGQFPIVVFSPEDLALVRGDPAVRRRLMTDLAIHRRPSLGAVFARYERVLRQRNTLLKSARAAGLRATGLDTLDVWDQQLADLSAVIEVDRRDLLHEIEPDVDARYRQLSGDESPVTLGVSSTGMNGNDISVDGFLHALSQRRAEDLDRAQTSVGPHRDELLIAIGDLIARNHASHGESWSLALALRLAEIESVRRLSRIGDPIVMLDDVFAELDARRRGRLAQMVARYEQVIISAAVAEELPPLPTATMIAVQSGRIEVGA